MFGGIFEAIKNKINAEAEAIKKAAAEAAAKTAAETAAIQSSTKMKEEADTLAREVIKTRNRIRAIVGGATFLFLIGDYIYHDSETFIKWNMKRHIRMGSSVVNPSPSSTPEFAFPRTGTRQLPSLTNLPVILVGPSGCGKSTVLTDLALELKSKKIPVVHINFRKLDLNKDQQGSKPEVDKSKVDDKEAPRLGGDVLLSNLAKLLCDRINFPYRRSILAQLMPVASFDMFGVRLSFKDLPRELSVADKALELLFECCFEIAKEGPTPVLLFDEVYDMIRDKSLEKAGGDYLFRSLGELLCTTCVDNHYVKVRAVAASSSYHAVTQFKVRTRLKDDKLDVFRLLDIEPELIIARLVERGYTESEAAKILDVVGPRLRKLEGPLKGDPRPELQSWIEKQMEAAKDSFRLTFKPLDQKQRRQLISLFEILEKEGSVRYPGEFEQLIDELDLSRILYISNKGIIFQSRLHENYWAQNRDSLKEIYGQ